MPDIFFSWFGDEFPDNLYRNRIWHPSTEVFVYWTTYEPDSTGTSYPGPGTFGVDTEDYCVEKEWTTVQTRNRVWDTVQGGHVRWMTANPDPDGASYPGPGTYGDDTSDYCVEHESYTI